MRVKELNEDEYSGYWSSHPNILKQCAKVFNMNPDDFRKIYQVHHINNIHNKETNKQSQLLAVVTKEQHDELTRRYNNLKKEVLKTFVNEFEKQFYNYQEEKNIHIPTIAELIEKARKIDNRGATESMELNEFKVEGSAKDLSKLWDYTEYYSFEEKDYDPDYTEAIEETIEDSYQGFQHLGFAVADEEVREQLSDNGLDILAVITDGKTPEVVTLVGGRLMPVELAEVKDALETINNEGEAIESLREDYNEDPESYDEVFNTLDDIDFILKQTFEMEDSEWTTDYCENLVQTLEDRLDTLKQKVNELKSRDDSEQEVKIDTDVESAKEETIEEEQ